jgi:two-component system nitrate/nitrite response regulator NarL
MRRSPRHIPRLEVADRHPIFRDGLARSLGGWDGAELVAQAGDGATALSELRRMRPDVAVIDDDLPGVDGPMIAAIARREGIATRVLVLADALDGRHAHRALRSGAAGYLTKDADLDELRNAVRAVAAGGVVLPLPVLTGVAREIRLRHRSGRPALSRRERQVLELVAGDFSTEQIADRLCLSAATIKSHLRRVYEALGVCDRAAAIAVAMRLGLLE